MKLLYHSCNLQVHINDHFAIVEESLYFSSMLNVRGKRSERTFAKYQKTWFISVIPRALKAAFIKVKLILSSLYCP